MRRKAVRRRMVRYGILAANAALLIFVITLVSISSSEPGKPEALMAATNVPTINPTDRPTSYDIALSIANATDWSEALAVKNDADSVRIQYAAASLSSGVVSKPQIVATALKSRRDIQNYTVQAGDTVTSIAQKFGVTSDSIRWSNNLSSDHVSAGKALVIPPVDGIVYTVKAGDTPQSLASKFRANVDQIIAYNDAEINGLKLGEQVIIPNGRVVTPAAYGGYSGFAWGGYSAIYAGNGYVPGQCTWYVADMRARNGSPIPSNLGNANAWLQGAIFAHMSVGRTPRPGAIIWFNPPGGVFSRSDVPRGQTPAFLGHVGYVDGVDTDGTVRASDMNWIGPYAVRHFTLSADQANNYWYIY